MRGLAVIDIEQGNPNSVLHSFITTPYCHQPEDVTKLRDTVYIALTLRCRKCQMMEKCRIRL